MACRRTDCRILDHQLRLFDASSRWWEVSGQGAVGFGLSPRLRGNFAGHQLGRADHGVIPALAGNRKADSRLRSKRARGCLGPLSWTGSNSRDDFPAEPSTARTRTFCRNTALRRPRTRCHCETSLRSRAATPTADSSRRRGSGPQSRSVTRSIASVGVRVASLPGLTPTRRNSTQRPGSPPMRSDVRTDLMRVRIPS